MPSLADTASAVQVMAPLVLTFLVLVLAAALALWTSASGGLVIWATLLSVGLMGATTALLQGGLFGLAGLCPPIYVQVRRPALSASRPHASRHDCCVAAHLSRTRTHTISGLHYSRQRLLAFEHPCRAPKVIWQ